MRLHKFDIVLVRFPFSDLSKSKFRPALLVKTLPGANAIFCQITTKQRRIKTFEILLRREHCEGDIRFDSRAYVDMLFTLHHSIIRRKLGRVRNPVICQQVEEKLTTLFCGERTRRTAA
ncbi:MAG: type II toxin-antitoxin system PemK/MazF family toxin [Bacteroidota bacterium]